MSALSFRALCLVFLLVSIMAFISDYACSPVKLKIQKAPKSNQINGKIINGQWGRLGKRDIFDECEKFKHLTLNFYLRCLSSIKSKPS